MWNVTLYYNTGFNAVNIPDKPSLLASMSKSTFATLDILQADRLNNVVIKATLNDVKNADYMLLSDGTDNYYYFVSDYEMTSRDVCRLYITIDYFLTIGGVDSIDFLDGITERHHVAKADDTFGAYTEDDPLMVPSKELTYDTVNLFTDMVADDTVSQHIIVETSLDLADTGDDDLAKTYTSEGGDSVTVPMVKCTDKKTAVLVKTNPVEVGEHTFITPQTVYCDADNVKVIAGMSTARYLGVDDAILSSYILPDAAVSDYSSFIDADGNISMLSGVCDTESTSLSFEYASVQNKRVLYGDLSQYVLVSPATGNAKYFKPEDICTGNGTQLSSPGVTMITDPRPNGRPYFRFTYYKDDAWEFLTNAVEGMQWAEAPLRFSQASGMWKMKLQHDTTVGVLKRSQNMDETSNKVSNILGFLGTASQATDFVTMEKNQMFEQGVDSVTNLSSMGLGIGLNFVSQGMQGALRSQQTENSYKNAYIQELVSYISGQVVAPQLKFAHSDTMRDFRGNGCVVFRYRPQTSDIAKLDKILTMYGYRDTKTIEKSDLTNRSKFNYIKANGVSIGGTSPRWLRDGVAMQLSVGTRIWHVKPDKAIYTNGTNV